MRRFDTTAARRAKVTAVLVACVLAFPTAGGPASAGSGDKPRLRLPNLIPLAPETFFGPWTQAEPNYFMGGGAVVDGCTPDEIARKLARRCLRFDTILANVGRGPFEVGYMVDPPRAVVAARQHIYRTNGTFKVRFATESEFHPTHAHFHIKDIYLAKLWRVNRRYRPVGRQPIASSDKNGFCPADIRPVRRNAKEPHYSCLGDDAFLSGSAVQIVGLTPGWADIYPAEVPDQFVEISGVPDGIYLFELRVDPHNFFVESSENDNRVCVLLNLQGSSVSPWGTRRCP